ncbi:hypothetical protein [Bacillus sp. B15-48]|uniref:hypothetical protein n=1 Tax=Bacillus sp. B15-48 TaxID=1548601 RepID=UPI00193EEA49|nr:hypothetical protein [Bacillus sp. B15-48]MBM4763438.1 hypothetical protein [Bacillus sp. B15-48]
MSLFSIVAKEEFISVVLGKYEYEHSDQIGKEKTTFHEITPQQSFIIFSGENDLGEETVQLVRNLIEEGKTLQEIAHTVLEEWNQWERNTNHLEAVIGGISVDNGQIQYHIITANHEIQSYYPKKGESLYYANDVTARVNSMEELARRLMMTGMSSINQAQNAQLELLEKFAGIKPGSSLVPHILVMEKPH